MDNKVYFPGYKPKVDPLSDDRPIIQKLNLFAKMLADGCYGDPKCLTLVLLNETGKTNLFLFADDEYEEDAQRKLAAIGSLEMAKSVVVSDLIARSFGEDESDGDDT